ncbi:MAG: hypothetical protein WC609_00860 [Candidatus Paceibacterota bacterium]|jgi:hypothetical protein
MEKELQEVFQKAKYEIDSDLPLNIWQKMVKRNKRINRTRLWVFSSMGILSFGGALPVFKILLNDVAQSGFYEYLSLVFSSNSPALSYPKEFFFLIAESLPTTSIVLSLSLIFILFLSLKYLTREIIKNQLLLSY